MGEIIKLTREERERFAAWCEQDAASTLGIVEQMAKLLPGHSAVLGLAKLKRTEAMAQQIVAKMLRSIEETTLG